MSKKSVVFEVRFLFCVRCQKSTGHAKINNFIWKSYNFYHYLYVCLECGKKRYLTLEVKQDEQKDLSQV